MRLESNHRLEQLMAEVRNCTQLQARDSERARTLMEKLHLVAEEGHRVANEEKILSSLKFDKWKRRFNIVSKAHAQTFDWMLKDTTGGEAPPTRFKLWLQSQNGIYWVAGKAGSGKSTLMKFLANHEQVLRYLQDLGRSRLSSFPTFMVLLECWIANAKVTKRPLPVPSIPDTQTLSLADAYFVSGKVGRR